MTLEMFAFKPAGQCNLYQPIQHLFRHFAWFKLSPGLDAKRAFGSLTAGSYLVSLSLASLSGCSQVNKAMQGPYQLDGSGHLHVLTRLGFL